MYYELVFGDDALPNDQGDPLAFVGVTPVLQPGEIFVPPEAALIVPGTPGVSVAMVTYLAAYAPALNMPDTLVTTISFDSPTAVKEKPVIGLSLHQNTTQPVQPHDHDLILVAVSSAGASEYLRRYRPARGNPDRRDGGAGSPRR